MQKTLFVAAALCGLACTSTSTIPLVASAAPAAGDEVVVSLDVPTIEEREAPESVLPTFDADMLAALPPAPWSAAPHAAEEVPAIVMAWASAENRTWCAPLAPTTDAAISARVSDLDGGWLVEFDQAGMPGVATSGEPCENCGRGVFGIAGTSMGVDEMLEQPTPSYADGSATEVTPGEDNVAAATIAVPGQGCVYQVWSFLGSEHLESVLDDLRFVATDDAAPTVAGLDIPYD